MVVRYVCTVDVYQPDLRFFLELQDCYVVSSFSSSAQNSLSENKPLPQPSCLSLWLRLQVGMVMQLRPGARPSLYFSWLKESRGHKLSRHYPKRLRVYCEGSADFNLHSRILLYTRSPWDAKPRQVDDDLFELQKGRWEQKPRDWGCQEAAKVSGFLRASRMVCRLRRLGLELPGLTLVYCLICLLIYIYRVLYTFTSGSNLITEIPLRPIAAHRRCISVGVARRAETQYREKLWWPFFSLPQSSVLQLDLCSTVPHACCLITRHLWTLGSLE